MQRAVIDIGSNTVKLFVADIEDGRIIPIVEKDRTTRLGEGLAARDSGPSDWKRAAADAEIPVAPKLSSAAIARTIQAIDDFLKEARSIGAHDVLALTTSAVRDAENRDAFLEGVRSRCGLNVQVITGEREAELIFRGVSSDPEWSGRPILVVDVGGGSTEFIQGAGPRIEQLRSLPLGAVRLTEKFRDNYTALTEFLSETLRDSLKNYEIHGRRLIGTGGSGTTAARIVCGLADHTTLSQDAFRKLLERLRAMSLPERKKVPGLSPERADIIVAGGAVFLVAMEVLGAQQLTISIRNLRYGALLAT